MLGMSSKRFEEFQPEYVQPYMPNNLKLPKVDFDIFWHQIFYFLELWGDSDIKKEDFTPEVCNQIYEDWDYAVEVAQFIHHLKKSAKITPEG